MNDQLSPADVDALLDERTALVSRSDLADLVAVLDALDTGLRPQHVQPSAELLAWMAGEVPPAAPRTRNRLVRRLASAGIGVKLALAGAGAAATFAAAGSTGTLPAPAQDVVDRVFERFQPEAEHHDTGPVPQRLHRGKLLTPVDEPPDRVGDDTQPDHTPAGGGDQAPDAVTAPEPQAPHVPVTSPTPTSTPGNQGQDDDTPTPDDDVDADTDVDGGTDPDDDDAHPGDDADPGDDAADADGGAPGSDDQE